MAHKIGGIDRPPPASIADRPSVQPARAQVEFVVDRDIFAESVLAISQRDRVLDLGAHTPLQKHLSPFRSQFAGTHYLCMDLVSAPGLDFVADAARVPLRTASVDAVICLSLLEHVFEPWKVADEIHRVLKPDGVAFLYLPFLYEYHGAQGRPGTPDCYRFSIDAIRYLFRAFARIQVQPVGRAVESALRLLVARYASLDRLARRVGRLVDQLRSPQAGLYQASGYNVWLQKV